MTPSAVSRALALVAVALAMGILRIAEAAGGLQPVARRESSTRGQLRTASSDEDAGARLDSTPRTGSFDQKDRTRRDSMPRLSLRAQSAQPYDINDAELEWHPSNEAWRQRIYHEVASGFIFLACILLLCCIVVPITVYHRIRWGTFAAEGDSFLEYGQYRFFNWFSRSTWAPVIVVTALTVFAVVVGAILYAFCVGGSPAQAMFKVFIWASASSADQEKSVGGRFLGVLVTVFGLIILALLLSMVTEAFKLKMDQVKMGLGNVCEGGHVVLLGFSAGTKTLLEEMSVAWESEGGIIFVILATASKVEVEEELQHMGIRSSIRNSRVIVRSGNPSSYHSLKQVSADKASKVLSLMDETVSQEEALAKQIRVLLALKSQKWPLEGTIVVQVAADADVKLVRSIYPDTETTKVEVVVMGDIVAKLMAQSIWQHGLAGVFGTMLGFEGDEFYFKEFPDLVGRTFREAYFRMPLAVVLGIRRKEGVILNPGWNYKIQKGEEIIVLAEDDDTFDLEDAPFLDFNMSMSQSISPSRFKTVDKDRRSIYRAISTAGPCSTIIIGWNHNVGKLLATIDATFPHASEVTIFSHVTQEERDIFFARLDEEGISDLKNIVIKNIVVGREEMSSRTKLEKLEHWKSRAIFILAEDGGAGDDTNVAVLAQLQYIGKSKESEYTFDPVVEMCEHSTKDHLAVADLDNLIHSSSLISQALSAVTYDPKVNEIYNEFFVKTEVGFSIAKLEDFLPPRTSLRSLSFAEAALAVSGGSQTVLVGWSYTNAENNDVVWELNPKDKMATRAWAEKDRICVIERLNAGEMSRDVSPVTTPRS